MYICSLICKKKKKKLALSNPIKKCLQFIRDYYHHPLRIPGRATDYYCNIQTKFFKKNMKNRLNNETNKGVSFAEYFSVLVDIKYNYSFIDLAITDNN